MKKRRMVMTIAPSFLVYAGLYTAHLISAESSVTSIRSMNCAATIFFSSKLSSEKTSLSGMARSRFLALARCKDLLALFLKAGKRTLKVSTVQALIVGKRLQQAVCLAV